MCLIRDVPYIRENPVFISTNARSVVAPTGFHGPVPALNPDGADRYDQVLAKGVRVENVRSIPGRMSGGSLHQPPDLG
jgi:hypothetical protein